MLVSYWYQALVREQQALEKLTNIEEFISNLIEDSAEKTKEAVETAHKQYAKRIEQLMEDVNLTEMVNVQKQSFIIEMCMEA